VYQKNTGTNRAELVLKVTDTGVGIPKDKLDTVFNSFTQESIDNKRKFGGLGLGLSIVKKLVDLHGGSVVIESEVGKGTCCTVVLPYEVVYVEPVVAKAKYPKDSFDLMGARI
jgi:signal transduction histidine kinase